MSYTQFPAPSTSYAETPAAWVRIRGASFNTIPAIRALFSGRNYSPDNNFILPLQRYTAPNQVVYSEVEPTGWEKFGQGIRDALTGDVSKLSSVVMNATGLDDWAKGIAGIGGASLLDISFSDLLFKAATKRVHQFGWTLIAKNRKDAENMDLIANNLQSRMYPFLLDTYSGKIKPPEMFRIEIYPNDGQAKKSLFRNSSAVLENQIQLSVLQSFDVKRLDNSGPVLTKTNKFLGLEVNATFVEIEPVYRTWNIGNFAGEKKHNTIMSRSQATAGSSVPVFGNAVFTAAGIVGDVLDEEIGQPITDAVGYPLNNLI